MKIRCAYCTDILGEKEPLDDKSFTDTICPECEELPPEELKELVSIRKIEQEIELRGGKINASKV